MSCRFLVWAVLVLCAPLHAFAESPNIILITLDTTRADRMGFLGSKRGITPNLDTLAKQSVVFTRAYAHVPLTTPSHATLLTGTYPQFNNISDLGTPLDRSLPYVPQLLHDKGYHTAAFLGAIVLDQKIGGAPGFDRGFDKYDAGFHRRGKNQSRYESMERRGGVVVDRALNWLAHRAPGPFFIWIHLYDAHDPYDPPEPYKSRYASEPYDGEIAYTDASVGKLLSTLRKNGLYDGAVIAVAADHGEAFGEHGERRHGIFLYDETIHVPLLLKLPGAHATRRVDSRVGLADVAPTLLQTAGLKIPGAMQAQPLPGIRPGSQSEEDRPQYSETNYAHRAFGWSTIRSWRAGKYLYVQAPKRELYDQSVDPPAEHNLAPSAAPVADVMSAQLDKFYTQTSRVNSGTTQLDAAQAENLRALGYLGTDSAKNDPKAADSGVDPKDKIETANKLHEALIDLEEDDGFAAAIPLLQQVIKEDPNVPIAYLELGRAQRKLKDYANAVPALQKAAELMPDSAQARYENGLVLVETRSWDAAAAQFEAAIKLEPKSPDFHTYLAVVFERLHRLEDASNEFQTTLQLDPENYKANLFLGRLLAMNGNPAPAVPYLKKAAKIQPQSPEPHQYLANTYHELGQMQDALRENAEAVRLHASPQ
jgi:arylsulfatase A-like enzyme/Tfp pilus assembly protein PilF